jgi:hypothetical protein
MVAICTSSPLCRRGARRETERGAVSAILVVILVALLGLVGLVFDLARGWIYQTELQSVADAAALAGATQLDGSPGARDRAVALATGAVARNNESFTRRGAGKAGAFDLVFPCGGDGCVMTNGSFRFLAGLAPKIDARRDAEARFIEVAASQGLRLSFAGVIGAPGTLSPRARAAASWTRLACGRPAIVLCNPDEAPGNLNPRAVFEAPVHFGKGLTLKPGSGPGDFIWAASLECDPASDSCAVKTDGVAVADELASVLPPESCQASVRGTSLGAGDLATAINARLDIYARAEDALDAGLQPSTNYLTGLIPADGAVIDGSLLACDFPGALEAPLQPYLGPGRHAPHGAVPLEHLGYPRDNCAYPGAGGSAPPDDCMATGGGRALGTGVWDLPAYMAHHHPGQDFSSWSFNACPSAGCGLNGGTAEDLDGDGRLSRWEVYRWELAGNPPRFGRPQCFGGGTVPLPAPPADSPRASDRRLLSAAVANCGAIAATLGAGALTDGQALPLARGDAVLHLFLSEAVGELAPNAFYAEIVDPKAIVGPTPVRVRDRVVLHE